MTRSDERRIVLHSSKDVLSVISNLTGQLAALTGEFAALKREHSKKAAVIHGLERNLTNLLDDKINESLIHVLQTNNSKQQSLVQVLQSNISNNEAAVRTIQDKIVRLQKGASSGYMYIRWGRNTCTGNGTETVYSRFAAGGSYHDTGATTNHLCLPSDPLWDYYTDTVDSHGKI